MQVEVSLRQAMTDYVILFADIEFAIGELYKLITREQYDHGSKVIKDLLKGSTDAKSLEFALRNVSHFPKCPSGETSVAWGGLNKYGQELIKRTQSRMIPDVRKRFVRSIVTVMLIMVAVRAEAAQAPPQAGP